tara:strand:+ start:1289 stop:1543 length:255 start_codon:yes stop_codon:yes gene_type:complete
VFDGGAESIVLHRGSFAANLPALSFVFRVTPEPPVYPVGIHAHVSLVNGGGLLLSGGTVLVAFALPRFQIEVVVVLAKGIARCL